MGQEAGTSTTILRYDLAMPAVVSQVLSATQFIARGLGGFDSGTFVNYSVWCQTKNDGTLGAPRADFPVLITTFEGRRAAFPIIPGTITHLPFSSGNLEVGDSVLIMNPAITGLFEGGVHITPVRGTTTALWNTAEANLVTLGAAGQVNKVNSLSIDINGLAGNIAIRLYSQVNGVERRFYPIPAATTFTVVGDAPSIPVINGAMGIFGQLRVTVQSDNALDNGVAVPYEAN